jgi:hypothetical protein
MLPLHHPHGSPRVFDVVTSRSRWWKTIIKGTIIVCVLLPLYLLATDRVTAWGEGQSFASRKMMRDLSSFPAAHLKNLVLVAGHAVYTGLDFSQASLESSWFLEAYQKVPGERHKWFTSACISKSSSSSKSRLHPFKWIWVHTAVF